jgi:hypothetical protein
MWQQRRATRAAARAPDGGHLAVAEHRVEILDALRYGACVAAVHGAHVGAELHAHPEVLEVAHRALHVRLLQHAAGRHHAYQRARLEPGGLHERRARRGIERKGRPRECGGGRQDEAPAVQLRTCR